MLQGTGGSTEAERLVALVSAKSRTIESLTQKCGDQASDNQALMEQMQTMHREFQTVKLDLNAQMQVAQSQAQMYGRQLEESQEQRNTAEQARTHSEDSSQREVAKLLALNTELKQADGMRADQERNFKLVSEKMTSTAKVKDEVVQLMQRKVASCEEESQRLHSLLERGKDETRALESSMKDKERQATSLLEKQQVLERELSVQERSKALLIHECDTLKEADMDAQMRIFELESMVRCRSGVPHSDLFCLTPVCPPFRLQSSARIWLRNNSTCRALKPMRCTAKNIRTLFKQCWKALP